MKKTIIMLFFLLGAYFNSIAQTIDIDNVRYRISGTRAFVKEYLGGKSTCSIQEEIHYNGNSYPVTEIGKNAFSNVHNYNPAIKEIYLPETIETIDERAFYCLNQLLKINLPLSLKNINGLAFHMCENLTKLIIPENVNFNLVPEFSWMGNFYDCNALRTLIYLGTQPPLNWTATSNTFVPDLMAYSSPKFNINNAHIIEMITFNQTEFVYTGQAPSTTWTNNVNGYTASLSMPALNGEAGSHEEWIPVTFTNGDESFTTSVVYRYTIKPVKLKAKVNNVSREYGEENPQFKISYSGFVNGENENVITSIPTISTAATKTSKVGEYPITISRGSAKNYEFVYESGVLTVTKAPLSAKVNDATKIYGSQNPAFTIEYYGLKNNESAPTWIISPTFQTEATKASGVGQYTIKAVNGVPVNYDIEIADGTLNITPASLTIKANDATRMYFENDPSFTFSCTGFVNSDNVGVLTKVPLFTTDAEKTSNVGNYLITPRGAEAKNYTISYEQGELRITKRQLKATSHCNRLYGEENPSLPIEYDGFVNNETEELIATKPIASTTAKKTSTVGDYPITISGGEATNYDFVYEQGVLTITKASLSAKVKDTTKVYGAQNPSFSIEYYGLKNGETVPTWTLSPTFQTDATQASGVGAYTVKAVNGVPVNYDLGEITAGTLNITTAPLTIKANNAVRQYYSDDPTFSYICNGFVNGDNESVLVTAPKLSTTATRTSSVGTYEIKVGETSSPNYSISFVNATLTITARTLIASVGNYERVYNEENPVFEVKCDGFVGNDDEKVLISKPEAKTTATRTSDVGTYPIKVTGGSADNYTFSYTSGILTINKAEQAIVWEQDLSALSVDDQVELKAEASSGLPVAYTIDQTNIAEIYSTGNKYYLDCKGEGTFQIVAVQNGDKNYYSSTRIRKTVTIGNSSGINLVTGDVDGNTKVYEVSGNQINKIQKGLNIIKMSNGTTKKVFVK